MMIQVTERKPYFWLKKGCTEKLQITQTESFLKSIFHLTEIYEIVLTKNG